MIIMLDGVVCSAFCQVGGGGLGMTNLAFSFYVDPLQTRSADQFGKDEPACTSLFLCSLLYVALALAYLSLACTTEETETEVHT
jgi:hypothetical protein